MLLWLMNLGFAGGGGDVAVSDEIIPAGGDDAPRLRNRDKINRLIEKARDKEDEEKLKFNKDLGQTLKDRYDELTGVKKRAVFDAVKPFVKQREKIPKTGQIRATAINWRKLAKSRVASELLVNEYYRKELTLELAKVKEDIDEDEVLGLLLGDM